MSKNKKRLSLSQRLWLAAISAVAFCVTLACSLFEKRDSKHVVTCYTPAATTETPEVLCYEAVEPPPTDTPSSTPEALCYTIAPTQAATPTMTAKPAADTPSPTPSPVCYTATPPPSLTPTPTTSAASPQALLEHLLAEGRLPDRAMREL